MIRSELEDAVGVENVSTKEIERAVYSVDYFWLSRKWQDAGEQGRTVAKGVFSFHQESLDQVFRCGTADNGRYQHYQCPHSEIVK